MDRKGEVMQAEIDHCLFCELPKCDDNSPDCTLYKGDKNRSQNSYHQRNKHKPEYREKIRAAKQAWRATPTGKASHLKSVTKYNEKNPEVMKKAYRKYNAKRRKEKSNV